MNKRMDVIYLHPMAIEWLISKGVLQVKVIDGETLYFHQGVKIEPTIRTLEK